MDKFIITSLEKMVEEACLNENNMYGYGVWTHHIKPMIEIGKMLSKQYQADVEIVTIAILLHDLASIKDITKKDEHHLYGAKEAEAILREFNYPVEKIEKVKKCILNHRAKVNPTKESPEEICVADSDAMVHMDQIRSLFYLAYHKRKLSIEEGAAFLRRKMAGDYNKMSEIGKKLYQAKYNMIMELLGEENG